jgi:hypothetical protein
MDAPTEMRRFLIATSLALTTALVACDTSGDPTAPDDDAAPVVVAGQILPGGSGGGTASTKAPSGIRVELEGSPAFDVSDDAGRFRLEGHAPDGRLRLRFRRGSLDARLELEGIGPGALVRIEVELGDDGLSVSETRRGDGREFEGVATLASLRGSAPSRTLRLSVADTGGTRLVDVVEATTTIDVDGDLITFAAILDALEAGITFRVEGEGSVQADGAIRATSLEAEVDEDAGGDDDSGPGDGGDDNSGPGDGGDDDSGPGDGGDGQDLPEFEGAPTLVSLAGASPSRTLRVSVADEQGPVVVDIVEGVTTIDPEGDLITFDAIVGALAAGRSMKIEGEGSRGADGSLLAKSVKAETDED